MEELEDSLMLLSGGIQILINNGMPVSHVLGHGSHPKVDHLNKQGLDETVKGMEVLA